MVEIVTKEVIPDVSFDKRKPSLYINKNTYYGKCIFRNTDKSIHEENMDSQVKTEMYFINNTSRDITIMNRDGLGFTIRSKPVLNNSNLIIRKVYTMRGLGLRSAIKCMNSIENIDAEDLEQIKETLSNVSVDDFTDIRIVLDYEITINTINNNSDKTIYHYQTDLLVSLKDVIDIPNHPYSSRFNNIGSFGIRKDYKDIDLNNLQIKIRYVDHSPHASAKYINILGQVRVLYPEKDAPFRMLKIRGYNNKNVEITTTDYIEVFTTFRNDITNDKKNKEGIKVERYSLDEAKTVLRIYDTYKDAVINGDIDIVRRTELAELEHQLNIDKSEFQTRKTKFDEEAEQRKKELQDKQHEYNIKKHQLDLEKQTLELDQAKVERELTELRNMKAIIDAKIGYQTFETEYHKQNINMKIQNRKDIVDFIKFVPGVVVAITGLIGLYVKFNKKE